MDIMEEEDICGLCDKPGADKIHQPVYWPTERRPSSKYVHSECEEQEGFRAHQEFYRKVGDKGIRDFLISISR